MRVFKSKRFAKFARKEKLSNAKLWEVVQEIESGRVDADYGGGVLKQRIARPNEGKSGGYRSIILFRKGTRAFFVYGFAKNEKSTIDTTQERDFKLLAKVLLVAPDARLNTMIAMGELEEIDEV